MDIHFAPLQGYTDQVYRTCFQKYFTGVDKFYTPFMRTGNDGLIRKKDVRDIQSSENDTELIIPQILAKDADEMHLLMTEIEEQGYQHADLNLGCPFPMVVRSLRGSGLLSHPEKIKALLDEASKFTSIHLSVKLRLGLASPDELLQLLPILERYPLQHIAVHARTTKQQYKGTPDVNAFAAVYETAKLPLLYNGDLNSLEQMHEITDRFPKLKGLMLGRGLLQNPFLASQYLNNQVDSPSLQKNLNDFHSDLFREYQLRLSGDSHLLTKMKTLWDYLLPRMEKKLKKQIQKAKTIDNYLSAVRTALQETIILQS